MYVEIPFIGRETQSMKQRFTHLSSELRPGLDIRFFTKATNISPTVFPKQRSHREAHAIQCRIFSAMQRLRSVLHRKKQLVMR